MTHNNVVSLQGLAQFNPKTREYLLRIGSLNFPFKNAEEVFSYFLGRLKQRQKRTKTKQNFNFLSFSYVTNYLANYLTKLVNSKHQNTPKLCSHSFFRKFCFGGGFF